MRRVAIRCLAVSAVALTLLVQAAAPAEARSKGGEGQVFRYPTDLTENQLRLLIRSSEEPTTIVFEKGDYIFSPQLFFLSRSNLTLCGATGNAKDVTISSSGSGSGDGDGAVIQMEQVHAVTFRDLTIIGTAEPDAQNPSRTSQGIRMNAQLTADFSFFADGVTVDGCTIEADRPIVATARVRNLTVVGSTLACQATNRSGIEWGDGSGLLVTKTRFTTATGVRARTGVFVRGASVSNSEGERASTIVLTNNRITGDFLYGFDLADVQDVRVRRNKIQFSGGSIREADGAGRVGILVRRAASSSLPENYEITKNKVRSAHYGAWMLIAGQGRLLKNDFRRCGSPERDTSFVDHGGAARLDLFSANCQISFTGNDFRNLRSPGFAQSDPNDSSSPIVAVPAVVVSPAEQSGACFTGPDGRNKTSSGRELYLGAND